MLVRGPIWESIKKRVLKPHFGLESRVKRPAYKPTTVARKSQMGFRKGQPVFILDDPEGNAWAMQASSLIVDPNLTFDLLPTLGSKLKLAPGWKFRVQVLDQDLTIKAVDRNRTHRAGRFGKHLRPVRQWNHLAALDAAPGLHEPC